jgi:cell division protein FtsL
MKKIILFISIFFLIVTTSLVKNSTKKTEDEIYSTSENIRSLKNELGDVLLEYNYLSSPEKLLDYQANYFENDLIRLDIIKIKKITKKNNRLIVSDFNQAIEKND